MPKRLEVGRIDGAAQNVGGLPKVGFDLVQGDGFLRQKRLTLFEVRCANGIILSVWRKIAALSAGRCRRTRTISQKVEVAMT